MATSPPNSGIPTERTMVSAGPAAAGPPVPNASGRRLDETVIPGIRFLRQLTELVDRSQTKSELVQHIGGLLSSTGCKGLWITVRDQQDQWSSDPISVFGADADLMQSLQAPLEHAMTLVRQKVSPACLELQFIPGNVLLAAPVCSGGEATDIFVGLFPSTSPQGIAYDWALAAVTDAIAKWQLHRQIASASNQLSSLSSYVNLTAAVNRTENQLEASITLVNELKAATQTSHVALLLRSSRRGPYRLAAMSGVEFFDRQANTTQTIESTVLGLNDQPVFWYRDAAKTGDDQERGELMVNLQNFCSAFESPGCALIPLRNSDDETFGWLLLSLTESQCGNAQLERHYKQIGSLVAGQLATVLKSQRTMTRVCLDNSRQILRKRWTRKLLIVALVVGIVLCIPFRYKVGCDCQLQLTSRRFVAAPYDGLLEKTLVENGDIVAAGEALALMDAHQLRMELSALEANLQSEQKKSDSALARGSVAESQIARSEMARIESEIAIVRQRLENTEIRTPIAGVVVSGDMDKAEGAPLDMGQTLFEIGPLDNMIVEILVPENEIRNVESGMDVRFEFNAFPFETFQGTIQRIHPRAEVIENESVFVAEIAIDNQSGKLRPGMKGRAKVIGNRHPLGWNLFHGVIDKSRRWLIW